MTDRETWLQSIRSNPSDWQAMLVFADWLEEESRRQNSLPRLSVRDHPAASRSAVIVNSPCAPASNRLKLATRLSSPLELTAPKHSGNLTHGAADSKNSQEHLLTLPIIFVKISPAVLEADKQIQRFAKADL